MIRRASLLLTLGALALAAVLGVIFLLGEDAPRDGGRSTSDAGTLGAAPRDAPPIWLPDPTAATGGGGAATPPDVERPVEVLGTDEPLTMVVGRVITRSGHPLPGALVTPYRLVRDPPFSTRLELPQTVRSDDAGRFDIAALPDHVALGVEVRHETHAPQMRETFEVEDGQRVDIGDIVLSDGMSLTGTVMDEQSAPVPGARIVLSEVSGGLKRDPDEMLLETLSDPDGRYAFDHLALRQYSIDVGAEGFGRVTTVLSLVLATSSAGWKQDFRLERDDSLLGGVVIGTGERPLADIGVRITRRQRTGNSYYLRTLRTAADGSFLFERIPDGRYQLDLEADGWYLQKPLEIAAGRDDTPIHALPALVVRGQLFVERGDPPGDFRVIIRPDGRTGAGMLGTGAYERDLRDTEPRGSFVLGGLRPGSYRFEIRADSFAITTSSDVIIGAAAAGADVVITLLRGGTVAGRVTPAAEGVEVELRGDDYDPSSAIEATFPTPPIHGLRTVTDAEGRFRFQHVPPETYTVSALPTSAPPAHTHGVVVSDEHLTDVGVLSLTAGGTISGNVLGPDGRPRQGVRVAADGAEHHQQTVTDAQGGFRLDALPAGEYEVYATPPGLWEALRFEARQQVTLRVGDEVAVLLTLTERGDQPR